MLRSLAYASLAVTAVSAVPTPKFPVSWTASEVQTIAIAQGTTTGPNGDICCAPDAAKCQAQTQSQAGTNYYDGMNNQTRFDSAGQSIVTLWGNVNKEMAVAPNGTCVEYCPVEGPFDPSPFWPTPDQHEIIKDLGKVTVNGVETTHFQWIEHILGVIKVQETNMYVQLPSDPSKEATPVWEHDVLEPFGQPVGTEDTHWTTFTPGQPDASLFKVNGIAECPMSQNCGNNQDALRLSRRLRDRDFNTLLKYETDKRQLAAASSSFSKIQQLSCGVGAASLTMTLDSSSYSSEQYFSVKDASIRDNYHAGQLTCVGSTLNSNGAIDCVGFDNGSGAFVFEVHVGPSEKNSGDIVASYKFLKPAGPPQTPGEWPCKITKA